MRRFFLAMALAVAAAAPAQALAEDQAAAQQIANSLRTSGRLKGYSIGVKYNEGVATLEGRVSSVQQMAAALAVARQQPGVSQVVNKMSVGTASPVRQAAASAPAGQPAMNAPAMQQRAMRMPPQQMMPQQGQMHPAMMQQQMPPQMQQMPRPINGVPRMAMNGGPECLDGVSGGGMPPGAGGGGEYVGGAPAPVAMAGLAAGNMGQAHYDAPHMPNYAWPSYAAYPNYAAVTYPRQYSPTAWPYIGPFYPYPQVPLGWRKVTLEWDDGWWFLDFKDNCEH